MHRWFIVLALACAMVGMAAELPELKTGGKEGGPAAILFFGPHPWMDTGYAADLTRRGAAYENVSYFDPLTTPS